MRPKKRSMLVHWPSSSAVQLGAGTSGSSGASHSRYWWRIVKLSMILSLSLHRPRPIFEFATNIFQGMTATAPSVV
jgi:hypothetical protein